jgi:hypothetical protein
MLDQLVSTPAALLQVAGSTPSGSEFRLRVKKSPSLVPCAKALVVAARPACGNGILEVPAQEWQGATGVPAQVTVPTVSIPSVGAGPGFGGFLGPGY